MERHALTVIGLSASSLRYRPAPDRNADLRQTIVALAHGHRRYGAGMIYLKVRQQGRLVNHKRIERLYAEAQLQVRRRTRKKVPGGERLPLVRSADANHVWSMDFVFHHSAEGRPYVTWILDHLAATRGLPQVIRTDNGKEFCGRTILTWTHAHTVTLRLIEPDKPNQNSYIESFNGRLRDECLNEHWFLTLAHAQVVIEAWRREYNEERPKKALGGLTPAAYARRLVRKSVTVAPGLQT
jgi:putative transposase